MKRLISIFFIVLILMNVMGYYGVFVGLKFRNDVQMARQFDAETYDASEVVTLHVPLSLPYGAASSDFERVDGKIEHNGEVFRLVKQKVSNDTLTIVCVRDRKEKEINLAVSAYVKTFTDQHSTNQSSGKMTISLIKDFLPESFRVISGTNGWVIDIVQNTSSIAFIPSFVSDVVHPPERA